MKLLDLYCGTGGWSDAFAARGWECVGIDVKNHGYQHELVLWPLPETPMYIASFGADFIVASPPCQEFARHHLPWIAGPAPDETHLRWAVALGRQVGTPTLVECSRFASWHLTGSRRCGSYHLWGNVPLLLPIGTPRRKSSRCGEDPAARARIEPWLSDWIADWATTMVKESH